MTFDLDSAIVGESDRRGRRAKGVAGIERSGRGHYAVAGRASIAILAGKWTLMTDTVMTILTLTKLFYFG